MVSILLPVFNSENYLKEAISSVIRQTSDDWELIAINDASSDNSPSILRNYAERDNRIQLIDFEKNKGQGYARNRAIEMAKGDYILFLDADDFLDEAALEILNQEILKKSEINVFVWGYQIKTSKSKKERIYLPTKPNKEKNETPFQLGMLGRKGFGVFPWLYVAKRSFLLANNIRFAEGIYFEDVQFTTQLLFFAQKVKIIKKVCYFYRKHPNSVTSRSSKQKIDNKFTAFTSIKNFLQVQGVLHQYQGLYLIRFLALCVHTSFNEYLVLPETERDKELDAYMLKIRNSQLLRKENLLLLRDFGLSLPKEEKMARKAYLRAYYGLKCIKNNYRLRRLIMCISGKIYLMRKGLN